MTSRPRLATNSRQVVGLVAVALFGVLAAVFLTADFQGTFTDPGFGGAPITPSIGYAMFDMQEAAAVPVEGFIVAFEIIDIVLVAALVGAVMLARREERALGFRASTDERQPGEAGSTPSEAGARPDGGTQGGDAEGGDR